MTERKSKMIERKCKWCGDDFLARKADVKRGWGVFCSKSCKAKHQEKRTGQYANYKTREGRKNLLGYDEGGEFYANFSNEDDSDM